MSTMCPAGLLLDSWLSDHDLSKAAFARQLRVARAMLWSWISGTRTPHIDNASQIERLTGIPASMWATRAELRPAPAPRSRRGAVLPEVVA